MGCEQASARMAHVDAEEAALFASELERRLECRRGCVREERALSAKISLASEKNAPQMAAILWRLTCQPFMGMRGSTSSFQSPASPSSTIAPATSVVSVGLVHHSSNPSAGQAAEGGVTWARQEPIGTVVRGEAAAWPLQCSLRHLALTAWALTDCLSGNCALALPHGDGVDGRQAGSRGPTVGRVHAGDGCEGREPVPGTGEAGGAGAAVLGCESAAGNPRVPVQNS